jgi:lipopolysaccharide biosynthesis regulator YciM
MLRARVALGAILALLSATSVVRGGEDASSLARRSLAECEEGRDSQVRDVREQHFARGQQMAERAVALDEQNAEAHFALFCNMGEAMRIDGESISSLIGLRRLMAELDRTLELNPDHVDALAAKGTMLLFGGDARKGEAMLRDVIQRDPTAVSSRLTLAKTCLARGEREEAITFATRAMQIARAQGRADKVAEAQATLAELRANR